MNRRLLAVLCAVAALGVFFASPWAYAQYDVYKYSQDDTAVPDVNKNAGTPPPDETCWLAVAANMLGAAGWGKDTQTAQQNADDIYGHLTAHFGTANPGYEERAINWWLLNYGYNPDAPDKNYYAPTKTYNDVTHVDRTLFNIDYDFLLDELNRCQYVGVSFMKPGCEVGHAMTLVGGNYSLLHQPPGNPQVAVWHDSDDGFSGDSVLPNRWAGGGTWYVDYQNNGLPEDDYLAENYTTLCPGLQKPQAAIENYDYAYFRDMDKVTGLWFLSGREAGAMKDVFTDPYWTADCMRLVIDNEVVQDYKKDVYLLVDYLDRDNTVDPGILLDTPTEQGLMPTEVTCSPDFGQILFHWALDYQPDWEEIVFPNVYYHDLSMDVKDFNVSTICVPEPAAWLMLLLAGICVLAFRRR
jgi:hypothetical protein